jgi:dephospho-CoA kinase
VKSATPSVRPVWRLGLTGGIGSGKSTLARLLQSHGADLIDADAISRQTTASGGSAISSIIRAFGQAFIDGDGALDRQRMRDHVFGKPEARDTLERIVHPLVSDEIRRQEAACTSPCIVFDIPLLVESSHWRPRLDRVLVVDCSPETQVRRVQHRSGWTVESIEAVMRSQSPRIVRLQAADAVVHNDTDDMQALQASAKVIAGRFGL